MKRPKSQKIDANNLPIKGPRLVTVTARVSGEDAELLKASRVNVSEVIRRALRQAADQLRKG